MGFQTLVSGSSVPLYTFVFPQHCSQWNRPRHSTKHPKPIVPPANRPQNRRRPTLTFTLLSCCSVYKAQTSTSHSNVKEYQMIPIAQWVVPGTSEWMLGRFTAVFWLFPLRRVEWPTVPHPILFPSLHSLVWTDLKAGRGAEHKPRPGN